MKNKGGDPQARAWLQSEDPAQFARLYDAYHKALYGVLHRIVENEELAADLLQEAFIKFWNHAQRYEPGKGSVFTWMLNISRNLAIDKLRSADYKVSKQNQNLENNVHKIDSAGGVTGEQDPTGLKELVATLPPEHRQLVSMAYFEGYTQVEIGQKLDMPLGTVKTRLRAAIKSLRSHFSVNI